MSGYNMNGAPGGANTSNDQSNYDLIFKDIIISSSNRNVSKYPNPNNYSVDLNINIDRIYKAELIEVYIPAATDPSVNVSTISNVLYFSYDSVDYNVVIQAGTYFSPMAVADELTRLIQSIPLTKIAMRYDENLNRYNFIDSNYDSSGFTGQISIDITSPNNIASVLNYTGTNSTNGEALPLVSGPRIIKSDTNNNLYVTTAVPGDFGNVGLYSDPLFSNCILSNLILTDCRIFLSLGPLDGTTVLQASGYNNTQVPSLFCQVPNNSYISSGNVKTILNQPSVYSSVQFYNPTVNNINKLDIKWYSETGTMLRILEHCFTIRVYYLQKRFTTTSFSTQVLNFSADSNTASFFKPAGNYR